MDREELLRKFETLRLWKSQGERAPHKPLLVLYAIGKLLQGEDRFISYADAIEADLEGLLREFGPRRNHYNPQFPFWRLRNDGIWKVSDVDKIRVTDSGDAYITDFRRYDVHGGFSRPVFEQLKNDPDLTFQIVQSLLDAHFPLSYHLDILQTVGIAFDAQRLLFRARDPRFRENILKAYHYRCAVCGFDVKLGVQPVGLEASHIKWHRAGGADTERNGLSLCSLHHQLFDRGVFTLSDRLEVLVSEYANGSTGFEEWLLRFHGKQISIPQRRSYYPEEASIAWHIKEVFKGDYREIR